MIWSHRLKDGYNWECLATGLAFDVDISSFVACHWLGTTFSQKVRSSFCGIGTDSYESALSIFSFGGITLNLGVL